MWKLSLILEEYPVKSINVKGCETAYKIFNVISLSTQITVTVTINLYLMVIIIIFTEVFMVTSKVFI